MTHDLEALLAAERSAPPAPAAAKARVLDAVHATIGALPPTGAPGASGGGTAGATGAAGAGSLAKLAGVFLAGAIGGATVHAVLREPAREVITVPVPVPVSVPVSVPAEIIRELPAEPVVTLDAGSRPIVRAKPERRDDLAAERVLLERARTALSRRSVTDALAALASHRDRFAKGQLREERLALEVQALVSAERRAEAEARAEELRREFPRSMFLPVIEAALTP